MFIPSCNFSTNKLNTKLFINVHKKKILHERIENPLTKGKNGEKQSRWMFFEMKFTSIHACNTYVVYLVAKERKNFATL